MVPHTGRPGSLVVTSNTTKVGRSGVRIPVQAQGFFTKDINCRERLIAWVSTIGRKLTREENAELFSR